MSKLLKSPKYPSCPKGCLLFEKVPIGGYFMGCGPRVRERLARGEPATAYEKVSGPRTVRGVRYAGGAVEMLLKKRGYGAKAAPYFPVRSGQCVKYLGPHDSDIARRKAIQLAERYQAWRAGRVPARVWRVA
jgi:hypothetical protein